jgi:GAF domain-containing protein
MKNDSSIPDNEVERMFAVKRYDVLDSPPDGAFDRITRLASTLLNVPISIVSIVDTDRIWFKSSQGLAEVLEIGRDPGLCASCILSDEAWIINDAQIDPRTLANPLVAGEFGLRFYAGVPLTTQDGFNLGTLCVIDHNPRELSTDEQQILYDLAAIVMDELELRLAARTLTKQTEERSRQATELNDDVVQSLAVAKISLELNDHEAAIKPVSDALDASKRILEELAKDSPTLRRQNKSNA